MIQQGLLEYSAYECVHLIHLQQHPRVGWGGGTSPRKDQENAVKHTDGQASETQDEGEGSSPTSADPNQLPSRISLEVRQPRDNSNPHPRVTNRTSRQMPDDRWKLGWQTGSWMDDLCILTHIP